MENIIEKYICQQSLYRNLWDHQVQIPQQGIIKFPLFSDITSFIWMYCNLEVVFFFLLQQSTSFVRCFFQAWFQWAIPLVHVFIHDCILLMNWRVWMENNSTLEVMKMLESMHTILLDHKTLNFLPLKVKKILIKKHKEELDAKFNMFSNPIHCL